MKLIYIVSILVVMSTATIASAGDEIYDVNGDYKVDALDAKETWANINGDDLGTYDVNQDGTIDALDAKAVWNHRGYEYDPGGQTFLEWIIDIFYG